MKSVAFALAATLLFVALPFEHRAGVVLGPVLLVSIASALAVTAGGSSPALSTLCGAAGALLAGLVPHSLPALAVGVLMAFVFLERTTRVRERNARIAHVALAFACGCAGGALASAFASVSLPLRGVATAMAVLLAAVPFLIEADDPVARRLDALAREIAGATGETLTRAADLRRNGDTTFIDRDAAMRADVGRAWHALSRTAESRARLERSRARGCSPPLSILERSDRNIAHHVTILLRAYGAYEVLEAASEALIEAERVC